METFGLAEGGPPEADALNNLRLTRPKFQSPSAPAHGRAFAEPASGGPTLGGDSRLGSFAVPLSRIIADSPRSRARTCVRGANADTER